MNFQNRFTCFTINSKKKQHGTILLNSEQNTIRNYPISKVIALPVGMLVLFYLLTFTARVQSNDVLVNTFTILSIFLSVFLLITLFVLHKKQKQPGIVVVIVQPHYVQMIMHLCIFVYWGWYWPQVYQQAILILAQLVFVHIFDLCFRWSQGQPWILGFGRFPIIFSTNLFLWFRDDWFYLQFVMITFGILAKDYFTWTKDGRRTHIFNPSAISLSVASLLLIITGTTEISWGNEISNTLNLPPYIYAEIFILGLIVQFLFGVTLVTLATVISLFLLGFIYYQLTGVYFFYTSDIPIAVFLGLHLLVTDPATSPKTNFGKFLFGLFYGLTVMVLFEVLEYFGAPTFYDKLLSIPILNLSIILLDKFARNTKVTSILSAVSSRNISPGKLNLIFMTIWFCIFFIWSQSGQLGKTHPGRESVYWEQACEKERRKACKVMHQLLEQECRNGSAVACARLGSLIRFGKGVSRDDHKAYEYVNQACKLGFKEACLHLHEYRPEN